MLSLLLVLGAQIPGMCADSALSPVSCRVAYFHLGRVKASCPDVLSAETLRVRAESQLRKAVETSLDRLATMQSEKRPTGEIAQVEQQCRNEVRAKQEALAELVDNNWRRVRAKVSQAASEVSQEKGCDVVVDLDGIYLGADRFEKNGIDITADIIQKLK